MSRKNGLRGFVAIAVLAMVAAACGGGGGGGGSPSATGPAPAEKVDVTLYFQGALTGPYNFLCVPAFQGAELRVKELNADPSFPATITLKQADTQGGNDQTPTLAQNAASDPNTVGIEGPCFSGETRTVGDTYNQAQIPFVTGSATAVDLSKNGWDYWYRTVGNDDLQGGNDGKFEADVIKAKKLFITNDKSDYGEPLSLTVKQVADQNGVQIAGTQGIAPTDNYAPLISAIKASGADSVFYGGYDADFAKIVSQGKDAGLDVTWMSGDGSASSTFLSTAADAAEGVYLSTFSNLKSSFVQKYNAAYGSKAYSVPVYSAEYYDVTGLLGEGIKRAVEGGATDATGIRAGIKDYLDGLTVDNPYGGVAKPIAFDPQTHELASKDLGTLFYFYQVENGVLKQLGSAAEVLT